MSRRSRDPGWRLPPAVVGLCGLLALSPVAHAQDPASPPVEAQEEATPFETRARAMDARVERMREGRGAETSAEAVAHARRALAEARRLHGTRPDAAERALGIADAALRLAERLAAREDARAALAEARTRLETARRRAGVAREALERAMVQRDADTP